jgi:hypothetical protein
MTIQTITRTASVPAAKPHRIVDRERLSEILDETLREQFRLHLLGTVAPDVIRNAGVPPLEDLERERERRERIRLMVRS